MGFQTGRRSPLVIYFVGTRSKNVIPLTYLGDCNGHVIAIRTLHVFVP